MLTTFHRNALHSTLGRWLGSFGVHQMTVPYPPLGEGQGAGKDKGGGGMTTQSNRNLLLPPKNQTISQNIPCKLFPPNKLPFEEKGRSWHAKPQMHMHTVGKRLEGPEILFFLFVFLVCCSLFAPYCCATRLVPFRVTRSPESCGAGLPATPFGAFPTRYYSHPFFFACLYVPPHGMPVDST